MLRWFLSCIVIVALAAGGFYFLVGAPRPGPIESAAPPTAEKKQAGARVQPEAKNVVHAAEGPAAAAGAKAPPDRGEPLPAAVVGAQPLIVIPEGRVNAIERQDVPIQYEKGGQLLFIGSEITADEASKLPATEVTKARVASLWVQLMPGEKEQKRIPESEIRRWRVQATRDRDSEGNYLAGTTEIREYRRLRDDEAVPITDTDIDPQKVQVLAEERFFRRLQEGDAVKEGQLLGMIDPSLAIDDLRIKKAKLQASVSDYDTAIKTRDEAKQRYDTSRRLFGNGKGYESEENMRGAKLTWERYIFDAISKMQAIYVAAAELKQAQTVLEMHALRSKISGRVKAVLRNKGEQAIKSTDPVVVQIFNPDRLRIEGLVEMQYVGLLKDGMEVVVEPTRFMRHDKLLRGHLHEITGVAVSKKNQIVSSSEDKTVRIWDRAGGEARMVLVHPTPVRAVACTPLDSEMNYCLTAANDGVARLYDLDQASNSPVQVLKAGHSGAINCVTFGPQGKWCATGGEDKAICLWDTATGTLLQKFAGTQKGVNSGDPAMAGGHRGAVTSLAFLSAHRLISAGTDKTLLAWTLRDDGSKAGPPLVFDRRSGDVATLGVNLPEQSVLFDYLRELRVLTVPDQKTIGALQAPSGAMNFSTMALFSPDGKLVLTAGGSEGRLQLWHPPTDKRRAYELCQLISPAQAATCGAFAPDGSFIVTGSRDRQVLVWNAPAKEQLAELTATVKFIEKALDNNSRQVRIWADLREPQGLVPGSTATLVVYP